MRSAVHSDLKRYEPALADIDRAIERAPESLALKIEKAALFEESEKYQEMLDFLEETVAQYPGEAMFLALRGFARATVMPWDSDPGFNDLSEALRLDPKNAMIFFLRARIRYKEGDQFGAIADFNRAIALDPSLMEARILKAGLTRDLVEAQNLVKLAPQNTKAMMILADVLLEKAMPEVSIPGALDIAARLEERGFDPNAVNLLRDLARRRAQCLDPFERFRNLAKSQGGCRG